MNYFSHFLSKELFPNCSAVEIGECFQNGFADNVLNLVSLLDEFRDFVKQPVIITSSFRNDSHNSRVGGKKLSQHLCGSAIDFQVKDFTFERVKLLFKHFLEKTAFKDMVGQVLFYNKREFIHVALRCPSHKSLTYSELELINYD